MTPTLKINGRRADPCILQNIRVQLTTMDFIDHTPTTKTFTNLKASKDKDLEVSMQVPANLERIQVNLHAEVMNTTSKQLESFDSNHTFNIETFVNKNHVHEFHLKMSKDSSYEVLVLGKNGEPKPLWPVNVSV